MSDRGQDQVVEAGNSSVVTALTVLEALSLTGAVGVSQLARQLDLPKSTVQLTLKATGWARQDADAKWSLTLRCAVISQRVMTRTTLSDAVRPLVRELRDRTGETARCFLIDAMNFVLLDVAESERAVRAVEEELPNSLPLHATAIGKAILAARPKDFAALLKKPLPGVTPRTITDADLLRGEIDQARERGWAQVLEETHLDVGGVAAVADAGSDVMIGMAVTFPLHRAPEGEVETYGGLAQAFAHRAAQVVGPRIPR
jgi:IclR family acetate operon transcriptional repressor